MDVYPIVYISSVIAALSVLFLIWFCVTSICQDDTEAQRYEDEMWKEQVLD